MEGQRSLAELRAKGSHVVGLRRAARVRDAAGLGGGSAHVPGPGRSRGGGGSRPARVGRRRRERDPGRRPAPPDPLPPRARASLGDRAAHPPSFAHPNGAPTSRAENDAFRALLLGRIVDEAFGLFADAPLPRTQRAFEALAAAGAARIDAAFRLWAPAVARTASELDGTLAALRSAAKHAGAKVAIAEIRAHMVQLFPVDLLAWVPLARLDHFPRYLRAARARLERAIADPRKDAEKLAIIAPLWTTFLAREAAARDREAVAALRWSFEELRVAVFAPELKTPVPVSPAMVASALAALR